MVGLQESKCLLSEHFSHDWNKTNKRVPFCHLMNRISLVGGDSDSIMT